MDFNYKNFFHVVRDGLLTYMFAGQIFNFIYNLDAPHSHINPNSTLFHQSYKVVKHFDRNDNDLIDTDLELMNFSNYLGLEKRLESKKDVNDLHILSAYSKIEHEEFLREFDKFVKSGKILLPKGVEKNGRN